MTCTVTCTVTCTLTRPATDLADASHPGDEELAEELVLHGHLGEEVVDLVVLPGRTPALPDHVREHEAGLWGGGGRGAVTPFGGCDSALP